MIRPDQLQCKRQQLATDIDTLDWAITEKWDPSTQSAIVTHLLHRTSPGCPRKPISIHLLSEERKERLFEEYRDLWDIDDSGLSNSAYIFSPKGEKT